MGDAFAELFVATGGTAARRPPPLWKTVILTTIPLHVCLWIKCARYAHWSRCLDYRMAGHCSIGALPSRSWNSASSCIFDICRYQCNHDILCWGSTNAFSIWRLVGRTATKISKSTGEYSWFWLFKCLSASFGAAGICGHLCTLWNICINWYMISRFSFSIIV